MLKLFTKNVVNGNGYIKYNKLTHIARHEPR